MVMMMMMMMMTSYRTPNHSRAPLTIAMNATAKMLKATTAIATMEMPTFMTTVAVSPWQSHLMIKAQLDPHHHIQ